VQYVHDCRQQSRAPSREPVDDRARGALLRRPVADGRLAVVLFQATIERELVDVLRSLGAARGAIIRRLGIPRSLPHVFALLKIAITLSLVGLIIAEIVAGNSGIGNVMLMPAPTSTCRRYLPPSSARWASAWMPSSRCLSAALPVGRFAPRPSSTPVVADTSLDRGRNVRYDRV